MIEEVWLPIKGYEGSYEVSNLGRVRSLDRLIKWKGTQAFCNGLIIKSYLNGGGYPRVNLSIERKIAYKTVHRLVAIAFIPNPENKPEVNHIDGCKTNNTVSNLEWVTRNENEIHAHKTGLKKALKGNENRHAKLTPELIKEAVDLKRAGTPFSVTSRRFGVSNSTLCKAVNGTNWNHLLSSSDV